MGHLVTVSGNELAIMMGTTMRGLKARLACGVVLALAGAAPLSAETLQEALAMAYKTNPTLEAQRAALRALDEEVPIARAQGLPNASVTGGHTENFLTADNNFVAPDRQVTATPSASLTVFSGGSIRAGVKAAKTRVDAGRAQLRGTEADLFNAVVRAYMDVIRDEAIVVLNQQNVHVLEVNLQATRDRFQVGDLTRTDVAQSEARLALARGQLDNAKSTLITSRETYLRLVGSPPGQLAPPPTLPNLPADPDTAVAVALDDNPTLLAARRSLDATRYDVQVAAGSRLPRVSLGISSNYSNYLGTLKTVDVTGRRVPASIQEFIQGQAGVQVTVPIYQGGRPSAQVRQAEARRSQAFGQVTETERAIIAQARSAYAVWQASLDVIESSATAVNANKLSLEGVRAENSVGNRTILEILNAEQELLNSQVTLVSARRDAYVAGFNLLVAMGKAEARNLNLDAGPLYDPTINYRRAHGSYLDFGDGPTPRPIATRTVGSKPQTADVNWRSDDPLLQPVSDDTIKAQTPRR